jgi:UDP-N-acetylglucosamine enolpyruvyl transferase
VPSGSARSTCTSAAWRPWGAKITLEGGDIVAEAPDGRLVGDTIFLGGANGSTVLGTANVMSAATLARGTTVIECAACEPEIVDLATMLIAMGRQDRGRWNAPHHHPRRGQPRRG